MRVLLASTLALVAVIPANAHPPPDPTTSALVPIIQGGRLDTDLRPPVERRLSTAEVICKVFGSYCSQALAVARCESGLYLWAQNGQYLGTFQMGDYARGRYGHAPHAWGQARAAYRYFVDSGRDWSPWACRPW